nr:PD-(D/E)XK nuclease family protein [Pelagicoccus albus]
MPFPDRVLSFSSLNKSLHRQEEQIDVSELESDSHVDDETVLLPDEPEEETSQELSIFTLPKGTHAGDLLHLILERYDFSRPDTLASTTEAAFDFLRFEPREYIPIVAAQIKAITEQPLKTEFGQFTLAETGSDCRIPELEFSYPVSGDVKTKIIETLSKNDLGRIPKSWQTSLAEDGETGFPASMLRGFIDLTLESDGRLYLFDWKSNYIGPSPADYSNKAILESMSEHNYFLQYLLYCVALKRYVEWRFPNQPFESLFGGVFYIYARGVSPGKETGVYYDLPSTKLLSELDEALGQGGVST